MLKKILVVVIVIVIIRLGFYLAFTSQKTYSPSEIPEGEISEPIPYEILSVGTWQEEIKWARYHIVIGKLLIEEEQVKTLAKRIIGDITIEDPDLKEVELFFYNDRDVACQPEMADAYTKWVAGEFFVKMIEGDIDFIEQPQRWKDEN